jgi:hypothetical protein
MPANTGSTTEGTMTVRTVCQRVAFMDRASLRKTALTSLTPAAVLRMTGKMPWMAALAIFVSRPTPKMLNSTGKSTILGTAYADRMMGSNTAPTVRLAPSANPMARPPAIAEAIPTAVS